ncbi:hypothetical protein M1446_05120 [Candidatus Dependentiae bacterium]|nr:hypothetical protein [Candidatus Dependentiae bacterium]
MKLFKLFFLLGIIFTVHSEYIVFKNSGQKILPITDEAEYKKVYNILQTYQWPMVIGSANKIDKKDLAELTKPGSPFAEEKFLRKKLKELSPIYDIVFIQTIFYETFFVTYQSNYRDFKEITNFNPEDFEFFSTLKKIKLDRNILDIIKNPKSTDQNIHDYYKQINFSKNIIKANHIVNNSILRFLNVSNTNPKEVLTRNNILELLRFIIDNKKNKWDETYLYDVAVREKLIDLEYVAQKKNLAILYRGGKSKPLYIVGTKGSYAPIEAQFLNTVRPPTQFLSPMPPTFEKLKIEYATKGESTKVRDWELPLNSLSYGNSLFAGYWFDSDPGYGGACACDYLALPDRIAYYLYIDKEKYVSGKLDSFFIPSLNTLAAMYSEGAFFHPRTRAFAPEEYIIKNKGKIQIPGMSFVAGTPTEISEWPSFIDNSGIFAPIGDLLEKAKELSEFIQLNATILKLPDIEGGFNPKSERITAYQKAQKDLTDMLKTMVTVRKYIRIKKETKKDGVLE